MGWNWLTNNCLRFLDGNGFIKIQTQYNRSGETQRISLESYRGGSRTIRACPQPLMARQKTQSYRRKSIQVSYFVFFFCVYMVNGYIMRVSGLWFTNEIDPQAKGRHLAPPEKFF